MTDPIADMLSRIRNASRVKKQSVTLPSSRLKVEIARVLKEEGYIKEYQVATGLPAQLTLVLAYVRDSIPAIHSLQRVSKPGSRTYATVDTLPVVMQHMGIAILSTSRGVMSNRQAKKDRVGGEVLCYIS